MVLQGKGLHLLGFRVCVLPQKRVPGKDGPPCTGGYAGSMVVGLGGGSRVQALLNLKPLL